MTGMKKRFCTLLLVAAATLIPVASHANGKGDWLQLDRNDDSIYSYDHAGIVRTNGNITVTTRVTYTPKGKEEALQMLENPIGHSDLAYTLYVHVIDCRNSSSRLLQSTHYDSSGKEIKSTNLSDVTKWEAIPENSRMKMIADAECSK